MCDFMSIKQKIIKSLYEHNPHGKGLYGKITAIMLIISFICFLVVLIAEVKKYI